MSSDAAALEGIIPAGTLFEGRYRVERCLAQGGMGAIYAATQVAVDRPVALKVIRAERVGDEHTVARFKREARALAALRHPHIIVLIDVGQTDDGVLYLVTEYLPGHTLAEYTAKHGAMSLELTTQLALQLLDALSHAHERQIIHRDLKPSNVMVEQRRGGLHATLIDFGIAKQRSGVEDTTLTQSGAIVGSPRYMSPEQARGREVIAQSDLYSLGVLLYEVLTGRPCFEESTTADYMVAHLTQQPEAPQRSGITLKGPLVDMLMACLAKAPWDRPANAEQVLNHLQGTTLSATEADTPPLSSEPLGADSLSPTKPATTRPERRTDATDKVAEGMQTATIAPASLPAPRTTRRPRWLWMGVFCATTAVALGLGLLVNGSDAEHTAPASTQSRTSAPGTSPEEATVGSATRPLTLHAPDTMPAQYDSVQHSPDTAGDTSHKTTDVTRTTPTDSRVLGAASGEDTHPARGSDSAVPGTPALTGLKASPDSQPTEAPKTTLVTLSTQPTRALVYEGATMLGRSPLDLSVRASRRITVRKQGYESLTVLLKQRDAPTRSVTLKRKTKSRRQPSQSNRKPSSKPKPSYKWID